MYVNMHVYKCRKDDYLKYQSSGEARVVVQLVEHLLSVCKGLGLMPALLHGRMSAVLALRGGRAFRGLGSSLATRHIGGHPRLHENMSKTEESSE